MDESNARVKAIELMTNKGVKNTSVSRPLANCLVRLMMIVLLITGMVKERMSKNYNF